MLSRKSDYEYGELLNSLYSEYNESWQRHCRTVGVVSQNIANNIDGCDSSFAYWYGLVHDVGKSTARSKKDARYHCVDGYLILDNLGLDELKMSPLTHSFPNLKDISLVPGYYNPLWDPEVSDKENLKIQGIWDTFIPSKLENYKGNIYDSIVCIADLMSAGDQVVEIQKRLMLVKEKYGTSPKDSKTLIAINEKVLEIEQLMKKNLCEVLKEIHEKNKSTQS